MGLVAVFAVFALFVFMLSLLCFCVLPFSSVNKDLYNDHVTSYVLNVTLFQVEMVIFSVTVLLMRGVLFLIIVKDQIGNESVPKMITNNTTN